MFMITAVGNKLRTQCYACTWFFCLVVIVVFMMNGSLYINLLLYHDVFHIQVFYSTVMDQWNSGMCVCVCAEA